MVCGSVSILSSTSSFPANSNIDSSFPTTSTVSFNFSKPNPIFYRKPLPFKFRAFLNRPENDGKVPQPFLENSSLADFMRFKRGNKDKDNNKAELQTAVVTYRKKFPWSLLQPFLRVDLVSNIHIADKEYFALLQKELESYDCVLYEMVASKESLENRRLTPNTKRLKSSRSKRFNIISFMQRQMANLLTLDFQLDCLDYESRNWYNADLDYETFQLLQAEKGESVFSFAEEMVTKTMLPAVSVPEDIAPWRSKLQQASRIPMPLIGLLIIESVCINTANLESEYPELEALSRLDIGAAMKVLLAKLLTSNIMGGTAEVERNSVIIGERNRVATEALKRSIREGNNKIAILYGGGHMPDLGRRLREELNLVPTGVQWLTAWSIRSRETESGSLPFLTTLGELSGWPLDRYQTLALLIFSLVLALDLLFWEGLVSTALSWISEGVPVISQFVENAKRL